MPSSVQLLLALARHNRNRRMGPGPDPCARPGVPMHRSSICPATSPTRRCPSPDRGPLPHRIAGQVSLPAPRRSLAHGPARPCDLAFFGVRHTRRPPSQPTHCSRGPRADLRTPRRAASSASAGCGQQDALSIHPCDRLPPGGPLRRRPREPGPGRQARCHRRDHDRLHTSHEPDRSTSCARRGRSGDGTGPVLVGTVPRLTGYRSHGPGKERFRATSGTFRVRVHRSHRGCSTPVLEQFDRRMLGVRVHRSHRGCSTPPSRPVGSPDRGP